MAAYPAAVFVALAANPWTAQSHEVAGLPRNFIALLLAALVWLTASPARADDPIWRDQDASGRVQVHLYFFWTRSCPHCQEQRPVVERLAKRHPWLIVHAHELSAEPEAAQLYVTIAESLGEQARYVPALAFCQTLTQGFVAEQELEARLLACRDQLHDRGPPEPEQTNVELPLFGEVELQRWSLPLTTVVLASLDAFNPCAFFVLLFLLSLLVRAHGRARMLVLSAIFIAVSGLWYFVFMAAWLNLFLWFGELRWMTIAAGVVAVIMGALNIKDFGAARRGPSLSIPERAKPGLFARMRKLARVSSLPAAVLATVVLAAVANTYELLCTAGLPMIYTRVLTLAGLSTAQYYLYLALYNVVYVLPLIAIVAISIRTLGKRKLQEHEGRALKLLSGLMMLGLGLALLLAPELLSRLGIAIALLLGAGVITAIMVVIDRRHRARAGGKAPTRA
jgi:thiol-disulfide isomerase/thioredoxin